MLKVCAFCKHALAKSQRRPHQKFCSEQCRIAYRYGYRPLHTRTLSAGVVGAITELDVASEVMKLGFEVYRALSPSSSCDLVVKKNGKLSSIEVRLAYKTLDGMVWPNFKNVRADFLVVGIYSKSGFELRCYPDSLLH